jgi:hypothetical protein
VIVSAIIERTPEALNAAKSIAACQGISLATGRFDLKKSEAKRIPGCHRLQRLIGH